MSEIKTTFSYELQFTWQVNTLLEELIWIFMWPNVVSQWTKCKRYKYNKRSDWLPVAICKNDRLILTCSFFLSLRRQRRIFFAAVVALLLFFVSFPCVFVMKMKWGTNNRPPKYYPSRTKKILPQITGKKMCSLTRTRPRTHTHRPNLLLCKLDCSVIVRLSDFCKEIPVLVNNYTFRLLFTLSHIIFVCYVQMYMYVCPMYVFVFGIRDNLSLSLYLLGKMFHIMSVHISPSWAGSEGWPSNV